MWTLVYIIILIQTTNIFATECGEVRFTEEIGFLIFPETQKYSHNLDCNWTISGTSGKIIILTFIQFDLEGALANSCLFDYLQIYDGPSALHNIIGKYCGTALPNGGTVSSTTHEMYLSFHSDISESHDGFTLIWRSALPGGCDGYYTSMNDSFSSPNYPSPYPHHSRCEYTIMVPEGYSITLTFTDFHVEADFDFVWIKESEVTLFKGNGSKENIPSINSSGNALFVYFTSDGSVSESGFSATYYTNRVVNGGWNSWLNWNSCNVICGGGISNRTRNCNNPSPSNGGTRCFGDSVESRVCNTNCCPVNGNWSMWSIWENCDVTCGFGMQKRTRACDNPYPVFNGINCTGNDLQTQNCSTTPCPVLVDSNTPDRNTQLYSSEVVGGIAVACIICTSVLCLIVLFTFQRLRQNKGRQEDTVAFFEGGENTVKFKQMRTSQIDDNAECIGPDNSQGDVC